jgi:N utilization substance protein B
MLAVDRAALRMAIFESVISKMIPVPVAISEAVELAKTFGAEESGKFVNGVLGRIVRALFPQGTDGGTQAKDQETPHGGTDNPPADG